MNQQATDFLKAKFYCGQITGEELMRRVEAEVRRDIAAEMEQLRGERDETAKELSLMRTLHASEKQAKIERGEMLIEEQRRLDWMAQSYDDAGNLTPEQEARMQGTFERVFARLRKEGRSNKEAVRLAIDAALQAS